MISRSAGREETVIDDWYDDDPAANPHQPGKQTCQSPRERPQCHQSK
jgi:hypothetical protein